MSRVPVAADLEARIRRGEPLRTLFDANVLLDAFLLRDNAVPAARAAIPAEAVAAIGHVSSNFVGDLPLRSRVGPRQRAASFAPLQPVDLVLHRNSACSEDVGSDFLQMQA